MDEKLFTVEPSMSGGGWSVEMTQEEGIKTYHNQLPNLLPQHEGKWALIINDGNLLVCDSEEEATRIGFATYGKINDFLVVRIEPEQCSWK